MYTVDHDIVHYLLFRSQLLIYFNHRETYRIIEYYLFSIILHCMLFIALYCVITITPHGYIILDVITL